MPSTSAAAGELSMSDNEPDPELVVEKIDLSFRVLDDNKNPRETP
jgi:hypothetical protein